MTNREIYDKAMHLLAQSTAIGENEDYLERAPYFLASFCTEAFETDKLLRNSIGANAISRIQKAYLSLDSEFPLSDRLATAASYYLAAMLTLDEDGELSDKLYDRYCDDMSTIRFELPSKLESVIDKYFPFI